jgi:hypothetical protein
MNPSNRFGAPILLVAAALVVGCASNPESNPTDDAHQASGKVYANPSTRPSFFRTDAPQGQYNNPLQNDADDSD